jgi:hypothetical protein
MIIMIYKMNSNEMLSDLRKESAIICKPIRLHNLTDKP